MWRLVTQIISSPKRLLKEWSARPVDQTKPVEQESYTAEQMPTSDPIAAEVMARALNSGQMVCASMDEDGNVTYS